MKDKAINELLVDVYYINTELARQALAKRIKYRLIATKQKNKKKGNE